MGSGSMVEVRKAFGAAVRAHRLRLGFSQERLAEQASLHRTYVADVERGARNLSLESISRLARALEVSISSLFMTRERSATEARLALTLGADASLVKPLDFHAFSSIAPKLDFSWTLLHAPKRSYQRRKPGKTHLHR